MLLDNEFNFTCINLSYLHSDYQIVYCLLQINGLFGGELFVLSKSGTVDHTGGIDGSCVIVQKRERVQTYPL